MASLLAARITAEKATKDTGAKAQTGFQEIADRWKPPTAQKNTVTPAQGDQQSLQMKPTGQLEGAVIHVDGDDAHRVKGTVNRTRLTGGYTHSQADGVQGGFNGTINAHDARVTGTVGIDLGDRVSGSESSALFVTGGLAGWNEKLGVVAQTAVATDVGTTVIGTKLAVTADRTINYLGPYPGKDETLKDHHRVEIQYKTEGSVQGSVGFTSHGVGLLGRLEVAKGKKLVYQTHLPAAQTAQTLDQDRGVRGFLRGKLEALGAAAQTIAIPRLDQPERLKTGDEVAVETVGKLKGGMVFGGYGTTIAATGQMEGHFLLKSKKLSENKVELTIAPQSITSYGLSGHTPLFGVYAATSISVSLSQSFVFDLTKPQAKAAYERALSGELPTNLPEKFTSPSKVTARDAARLLTAVRLEILPKGVERSLLEKAEIPSKVSGLDGGLRFLPSSLGLDGLGIQRLRAHGKVVITDGNSAITQDTRSHQRTQQALTSGRESHQVAARIRTWTSVTPEGGLASGLDRVVLGAELRDTKVRNHGQNTWIVEPLNRAFDLQLPEYQRSGHHQDRQVQVQLDLMPQDLEQLKQSSAYAVIDAADQTQTDRTATFELMSSLAGAQSPHTAATYVQKFVQKNKLPGFGTLFRLLGAKERLKLNTSSSAYNDAVQNVQKLALAYPEPVQPEESTKALRARFGQTHLALKAIKEALLDLDDDAVLKIHQPDVFKAHREALIEARQTAQALIRLNHLERPTRLALYAKIKHRAVLEDADRQLTQHHKPVKAEITKADLKARFEDIVPVIEDLERAIALLRSQSGLQRIDPKGYDDRLDRLQQARNQLHEQLCLNHLSPKQKDKLRERIKHRRTPNLHGPRSAASRLILARLG